MSLTNRFSTLLLVTLGLTLAGFSTALVVSSRIYLDRQVDDRLTAIFTLLNTCVGSQAGVGPMGAREKRLPPSRWNERHATTWLVYDGEGRLLTRPRHLPEQELPQAWVSRRRRRPSSRTSDRPAGPVVAGGAASRPAHRRSGARLRAAQGPTPGGQELPRRGRARRVRLARRDRGGAGDAGLVPRRHQHAGLGAGRPLRRWLSRKTLVPLTKLVESVRSLDATNPGWILAEVGTRDELDDLRRAFNDLLARLHEAYDRQRRFSSEASHQLRTPVAVMIGHLEVAQRYERSGDQYRRVIQLAHKRAVDLGQIVESLLFLSRPDSATLTRAETFDLGRWLIEHMASRPENLRSSDIVVESTRSISLCGSKPSRTCSVSWSRTCSTMPASTAGPGRPSSCGVAREGESALLAVEDSGCGIAPKDLPRIFEPFFRSSPAAGDGTPASGSACRSWSGS